MSPEICKRSILQLCLEAHPAPMTQADLLPLIAGGMDAPATVAQSLQALLAKGYLTNANPGGNRQAWYLITPTGVDQINRTAPALDRELWGKLAV